MSEKYLCVYLAEYNMLTHGVNIEPLTHYLSINKNP